MKSRRSSFVFIALLFSFIFPATPNLFAEDVNLSTYYPSPYGSYKKLQIEEANGSIGTFTGGVTQAGLQIISTYTAGNYTPGIFWTTSNNNAARPKAGIWMHEDSDATTGSSLHFGTSNDYLTGITKNDSLVINENGDVGVGINTPAASLQVVANANTVNGIFLSRFGDTPTDPTLFLSHNRGTATSSPLALPQANDWLGSIYFGSLRTLNALGYGAQIRAGVPSGSNWTSGVSHPGQLRFYTTPVGSVDPQERMALDPAGNLDMTADSATVRIPRKTSTGDPAGGQNGMIYYNTADQKFRVYQDGAWVDLVASTDAGCVSVQTGVAQIGYVILPFLVNDQNICEDDSGCSVSIWAYTAAKPAGAYYYENSAQEIHQALSGSNHHWHFSYSDGTGVNGDGTSKALISDWHAFYLYDDEPIGVNVGDDTNFNAMTIRDNTASYGFLVTICDV